MQRVAIVGVGLIGASFALALRAAGFAGEIIGVSSRRSLGDGIAAGAISRGVTLSEAAQWADVLYLSQPIERILTTLQTLGPIARPGCLVTDAGSTKAVIVETARRHLQYAAFLGGHPMAGKEQRGAAAAEAELFRGRPYVLTPLHRASEYATEFRLWLHRIGARLIDMDPHAHDHTVALTSHLPQLLSTALASTLARQNDGNIPIVFGPGLLDMTRLSLSPAEVWMSVLETNKEAVNKAVLAFSDVLRKLQLHLNNSTLQPEFEKAAAFSAEIRNLPFT
jgi:prephenate dehydrogenase